MFHNKFMYDNKFMYYAISTLFVLFLIASHILFLKVYIYMQSNLHSYFDNTKQINIMLSMTLFIIIIVMVIPTRLAYIRKSGQLLVIALLSYILYQSVSETRILSNVKKENEKDEVKPTVIANTVLNGFILLLLLYVVYLFFFRR